MHDATVLEFGDRRSWLTALVRAWSVAQDAARKRSGRFCVALSGGNTPKAFHQALVQNGLDWMDTHLFLGDERTVPWDDPQSNFGMVRDTLLFSAAVPDECVHPWRTELAPADAAADYEATLRRVLGPEPRLDLCLLGIGSDGHTASLFPGTSGLDVTDRLAVANDVPQLGTTRLTLTFPMLGASREIWFLVAGSDKQPILDELRRPGCDLPAARLRGAKVFYCRGDE